MDILTAETAYRVAPQGRRLKCWDRLDGQSFTITLDSPEQPAGDPLDWISPVVGLIPLPMYLELLFNLEDL